MIDQFRRALVRALGANVILALLWAFPLPAQQQPPQPPAASSNPSPSAAPSAPAAQASSPAPATADTKGTDDPPPVQQNSPKNDRLLYALPNYLTVENAKQLPPLTAGQKFKLVAEGTFDPVEYPFIGSEALIDQLNHDDEGSFGQGFRGYANRYAIAFGDTTVGNFMVGAVVPSLLHQDPRYYQLGTGGFFHRAAYAAGRVFVGSDTGYVYSLDWTSIPERCAGRSRRNRTMRRLALAAETQREAKPARSILVRIGTSGHRRF